MTGKWCGASVERLRGRHCAGNADGLHGGFFGRRRHRFSSLLGCNRFGSLLGRRLNGRRSGRWRSRHYWGGRSRREGSALLLRRGSRRFRAPRRLGSLRCPRPDDRWAHRIADDRAGHRSDRSENDRARQGSHSGTACPLLGGRSKRRQRQRGGDCRSCQNFLHGTLASPWLPRRSALTVMGQRCTGVRQARHAAGPKRSIVDKREHVLPAFVFHNEA